MNINDQLNNDQNSLFSDMLDFQDFSQDTRVKPGVSSWCNG